MLMTCCMLQFVLFGILQVINFELLGCRFWLYLGVFISRYPYVCVMVGLPVWFWGDIILYTLLLKVWVSHRLYPVQCWFWSPFRDFQTNSFVHRLVLECTWVGTYISTSLSISDNIWVCSWVCRRAEDVFTCLLSKDC